MSYKIVVDSCCELKDEYLNDPRFEVVPLSLEVGNYRILDDETFDQKDFLARVASCPECPKSACPSPDAYMNAYTTDADRVYVVTLSSVLSGSYNCAQLAKELYYEEYGEKLIHIVDSESASCGELQIVEELIRLEEEGHSFAEIVTMIEEFRSSIHTYFVLDNLDTFKKTGRLSGVKSVVASTLNIKPVLEGVKGAIGQLDQAIGMRKALSKMVDHIVEELKGSHDRVLMITHCNAPERAELVKKMILERAQFIKVQVLNMRGVSSMYANDGGIIVTI